MRKEKKKKDARTNQNSGMGKQKSLLKLFVTSSPLFRSATVQNFILGQG